MRYKTNIIDLEKIKLNEADTVSSILQNIAILLSTQQGSVPLYRSFGLPQSFVDKPLPVAKPLAIAEVKDAIEEFEPRATVISVTFQDGGEGAGMLVPIVEVEIADE